MAYDASPELMDEQLGFLFPALREAAMSRFARIMFEETRQFADALGEDGEIDLPVVMNELTVKIASRCLIGQEVRDQVDAGICRGRITTCKKASTPWDFFSPGFRPQRIGAATGPGDKWPSSSAGSWRNAGVPGPVRTISCRRSCTPVTRTAAL